MKRFIFLLASVILLVSEPRSVAVDARTIYRFEKALHGNRISIVLETGRFDPRGHKVTEAFSDSGPLVDGQRPIGNQGDTEATTEFKRFQVNWNGKRVQLDRGAWSSIFNVPLKIISPLSSDAAGIAIIPSLDGSSLLFYFRPHSGDTDDPEEAWLIIDRTGQWRKFHNRDSLEILQETMS